LVAGGLQAADTPALVWEQLAPLPDREGVAGAFAGVSHGTLLIAGGANFPDRKPWEGGRKAWHDTVWALDHPAGSWRVVGRLPRPLAYGVSASHRDGLVCVGGSDAERHHAESFRLALTAGALTQEPLPPLPIALANAAGDLVSDTLYVCGGTAQPGEQSALNRFFALDLADSKARWRELEPCPGRPRILPVAAAVEGAFFLIGGAALEARAGAVRRVYLNEVWRYRSGEGWRRLADVPQPCAAAASPAPAWAARFYLVSGDNGGLAGFTPVAQHPGFPGSVFEYTPAQDRWRLVGQTPAPRVTLPTVRWRDRWVLPSGEIRPGVRSPEVWTLREHP
jgi:N-acetylneuraminic acid mutarotase